MGGPAPAESKSKLAPAPGAPPAAGSPAAAAPPPPAAAGAAPPPGGAPPPANPAAGAPPGAALAQARGNEPPFQLKIEPDSKIQFKSNKMTEGDVNGVIKVTNTSKSRQCYKVYLLSK